MRTSKGCLFRACYSKGASHLHLIWQRLKGRQENLGGVGEEEGEESSDMFRWLEIWKQANLEAGPPM